MQQLGVNIGGIWRFELGFFVFFWFFTRHLLEAYAICSVRINVQC